MNAQQLSVKIYAVPAPDLDLEAIIPVFHRWIQEERLGDVLLIDVADYRHVPKGPGILLVGDGVQYALDEGGGELGLVFSRRRDPVGDVGAKLEEAITRALVAAHALEQEPTLAGKLRFSAGELRLQVLSRLVARNDDESVAVLRPHVAALIERLFPGAGVGIERDSDDPRAPLGLRVRAATTDPVGAVLARVA